MSSRVALEQELASLVDQLHQQRLHTQRPALAGIASKATDGSGARHHRRSATRSRMRRTLAIPLALLSITTTGSAALQANGSIGASAATATDGNKVVALGGAPDLDGEQSLALNLPVLDIAAKPGGNGYWLVAADGGVFTFGDAVFHGSAGGLRLNAPVVDLAPTPTGAGYWLVGADGGVFSYGDARFAGSLGGQSPAAPILGIAATPTGRGYWLVGADGGVFTFGDAGFFGAATGMSARAPIVEIAPTPSGAGYYLLSADGGVFAFGDAAFRGARVDAQNRDAIGIAVAADGAGYWVVRRSGAVDGFGVAAPGNVDTTAPDGTIHPAVGIAARAGGGLWVALGEEQRPAPAVPEPVPDVSQHPFLVCTRRIESGGNYGAINPSGTYRGAYQFSRSTWDSTARHMGRLDLVGVDPAAAAPRDQDVMALHLYEWQGARPWLGRCAGL